MARPSAAFDLDNPDAVWSLRAADMKTTDKTGLLAYTHSFLMLVDETNPQKPAIIDELHFAPHNGRKDAYQGAQMIVSRIINRAATVTGLESAFTKVADKAGLGDRLFYLDANAYRKRGRKLDELPTTVYDRGAPRRMLALWNEACRAAIEIRDLRHLFVTSVAGNNCRAGLKGTLESLGYTFKAAASSDKQRGTRTHLAAEIPAHPPAAINDDARLNDDYRTLHEQLSRRRGPR